MIEKNSIDPEEGCSGARDVNAPGTVHESALNIQIDTRAGEAEEHQFLGGQFR
jgi:hypothetical protein